MRSLAPPHCFLYLRDICYTRVVYASSFARALYLLSLLLIISLPFFQILFFFLLQDSSQPLVVALEYTKLPQRVGLLSSLNIFSGNRFLF